MIELSSVEADHDRATVLPVTLPRLIDGRDGGLVSAGGLLISSRSNVESTLLFVSWWTSAAMVLVPLTSRLPGIVNSFHVLSLVPGMDPLANVVGRSVPAGRLSRATSTPFR